MSHKTVLFVDDEERILKTIRRLAHGSPFRAIFAQSGAEALELLEHEDVQVIVTDMRMPEMTGLELLREVKARYPKIIRVVLSGYTDITTLLKAINDGQIFRFITKPWEKQEDLLSVIDEALRRAEGGVPQMSGVGADDAAGRANEEAS